MGMRESRRLEDGTPFVGRLGVLAHDPDEDKVQCHLCGGWYRAIGSSHLRRAHGWTLAEYRDAFRLPQRLATCSREVSRRLSANASRLIERGDFGQGVGVPIKRRGGPVRPWRTLAAAHPELVSELHRTRNKQGLDPKAIAAKSNLRVWWRCGHAVTNGRLRWDPAPPATAALSASTSAAGRRVPAQSCLSSRWRRCIPRWPPSEPTGQPLA